MFTEKTFKGYIKKRKSIVDKSLNAYLNKYGGSDNDVLRAMRYALFPGGKRIRPILCLEASKVCGGNVKSALPAACAIELMHNFSLVHDDLPSMDDDDLRRGKPTCHKKYGEATAILAGDALLALAYEALSRIKNENISQKLVRAISGSIGSRGMIGGQGLDIKYSRKEKSDALQTKINTLKTAELFSVTLKSGAISVSARDKYVNALGKFGMNFGKAFQVRDDIHDSKTPRKYLGTKIEMLKRLIEKAKANLEIFGKKADNLRCIADYLAN